MVRPDSENFTIQDFPLSNETERKKSSSGLITNRKGLLIYAIGIVGVLAIAGVAIGVSTSSDSSDESVAAPAVQSHPVEGFRLSHPQALRGIVETPRNKFKVVYPHQSKKLHHQLETKLEKAMKKRKLKLKAKTIHSPKTNSLVTVCDTPECEMSATSISEAMDPTADPCEDFFQFACGGWYESHPVTDHSRGSFVAADTLIQRRLRLILETQAGEGDPQPLVDIRTHYDACLDTDTMNSLGMSPLWAQIVAQGGMPMVMENWAEANFTLEEALVHILKIDAYPFVAVGIDSDFRNTTNKILYVQEGALGLSSSYLLDPENHATEIESYRTYISDSVKLLRDGINSLVDDAAIDQEVDDLVNFEISLAQTMSFIPLNKSDLLVKTDISEFQAATDAETSGQIDWLTFFKAMFRETDVVITGEEPLYVFGEKYFRKLSTLLSTTSTRTLANYLGWWWIQETGFETTYEMRNVSSTFSFNVYGSTPDNRTTHCVDQVNANLGFPLSRAYIDNFFSEETRAETEILIELMRSAFQSLLDENTWMAPDDLVVAKEKLDAITDQVAYPDWIMNNAELTLAYQGLSVLSEEEYDNLIRMSDYFNYWELETFRDDVKKKFLLPPTVVNAFYDVFANSITILAGILQPPFYTHNSLAALNYGGIGMVIGHEFTHGFDDNGRHFDKDGNLANWWSQETIDAFNDRSQCFVDQYNAYSPPELAGTEYSNMTVDGRQTLGENIADNGGIREAFRAYLDYVDTYGEEPRLPGLEEYNPNQLFFLGFANVWCEHKTTEDLVRQLNTDPHSPGRFRILGPLSNDADFANTFSCPISSPMNKGNESCVLW